MEKLKEKSEVLEMSLQALRQADADAVVLSVEEEALAKSFLLKEFTRLQELEEALSEREEACETLEKELGRRERRIVHDLENLKNNEIFFEKKMQILKEGYFGLDEDRRKLERERANFESEKKRHVGNRQTRSESYRQTFSNFESAKNSVYFAGVKDLLALKKRYRDLLKIYHPDNCSGDEQTLLHIQQEYEALLERL